MGQSARSGGYKWITQRDQSLLESNRQTCCTCGCGVSWRAELLSLSLSISLSLSLHSPLLLAHSLLRSKQVIYGIFILRVM